MQFACEDVGLCPFYGLNMKQCILFPISFCSRNHLLSEHLQRNHVSFDVKINSLASISSN